MRQDTTKVLSCRARPATNEEWRTGVLARQPADAGEGARATHFASQEISLANAKAAAAATPPITIVCNALRAGPVPV